MPWWQRYEKIDQDHINESNKRLTHSNMKVIHFTHKRLRFLQIVVVGVIVLTLLCYLYCDNSQSCGIKDLSHQTVFEYCNSPLKAQTSEEGTVATSKYQLLSVHTAIRHGDRLNMHSIKNYKSKQISCNILDYTELMTNIPRLKNYYYYMKTQAVRSEQQSFADMVLYPSNPWCRGSQLTPTGAAQHIVNGLLFKKRYLDHLQILDDAISVYEQIMIRSTKYSRTYQSSLAFMYGLLGDDLVVKSLKMQEAKTNSMCWESKDNMKCDCAYIEPFVDVMSTTFNQHQLPDKNSRTQNVVKHYAQVFDITPDSVPRFSHILDLSFIHVCYKGLLPQHSLESSSVKDSQCIQPWAIKDLYEEVTLNGENNAKSLLFQKICKLKMLPLLTDIKDKMLEEIEGKSTNKFTFYSGHDSTINPLAIALKFSDGHWAPYASRLVFELYLSKVSQSKSKHFIRIIFNGKVVNSDIDFCRKASEQLGSDTGLCPFAAFQEYVERTLLSEIGEVSYSSACSKVYS